MESTTQKGEPGYHGRYRIEVKMAAEEKELIIRAASETGAGMSEFVREAALEAARRVLREP
ncbi:MAG: DUF1778 domain-containing protein [Candidatus Baltobacteraceae bacterium]